MSTKQLISATRRRLLLVAAVGCLGLAGARSIADDPTVDRVLLVLAPGLSGAEIRRRDMAWLRDAASDAAAGWMLHRAARVPGAQDAEASLYASLGAGSRAVAPEVGQLSAPIADWVRLNRTRADHGVDLGMLGSCLAQSRVAAGTWGEPAGAEATRGAASVLWTRNGDGMIGSGSVSPEPAAGEPATPCGIWSAAASYSVPRSRRWVAVWQFGDLARAMESADVCTPEAADAHTAAALGRLRRLIERARAMRSDPARMQVWVIGLPAPPIGGARQRLGPVLLFGSKPGVLRGPSTRRTGIVLNTDLAPALLATLGVAAPRGLVGRPWSVDAATRPDAAAWLAIDDEVVAHAARIRVTGGWPVAQLIVLLATLGLTLWRPRVPQAAAWVRGLGAWLVQMPALLCLAGSAPAGVPALALAALVGVVSAALPVRLALGATGCRFVARLPLALALLVACDLVLGGRLMQRSLFGYAVLEGARFYGIGNEMSGAILAGVVAGFLLLPSRVAGSVALGLAVVSAAPGLGADAGGGVALAVAGVAGLTGARPLRTRLLALMSALVALAAVLAALAWADARSAHGASHLGLAVANADYAAIIGRKLAMNGYLALHSPWSLCLPVGVPVLLWRRLGGIPAPAASAAFWAGGAALLLLNDSGVVAAAVATLVCVGLLTALRPEEALDKLATQPHTEPVEAHFL
ncbi:MAG: hypothetical protein NT029_04600 [Armatimonadetes bacterium]|nr:hypothetical protein [Armatimonadota bacterium]